MWDFEKILTVSAAWVQAIGSLAALAVAIWIGKEQARRNEVMQRQQHQQQHAEFHQGVASICLEGIRIIDAAITNETWGASAQEFNAKFYVPAKDVADLIWSMLESGRVHGRSISGIIAFRNALLDAIETAKCTIGIASNELIAISIVAHHKALHAAFDDVLNSRLGE